MLKYIRKDFLLKIMALFISLALWLHVQLSKPQIAQELFNFEVKVVNLDRSKLAITRQSVDVIRIRASGSSEELKKIKGKTFSAFVDLLDAEVGLKEYRIQPQYPIEVNVEWERPPTVFVNVEALGHEFHKVVVVQDESVAPPGFTLGEPTVEPEMVKIEGAESRLESVATVRAVLLVDKQLKPGMKFPIPLEFLDKDNKIVPGVTADRIEVVVTPTLIPLLQRHSLLVVPLYRGQPAFGYQVESIDVSPNQVDLTGDDRKLSRLTTVETQPIDLTGLTETKTVEATLVIPNGGQAKRKSVSVRIRIGKVPQPANMPDPPGATTGTTNGNP